MTEMSVVRRRMDDDLDEVANLPVHRTAMDVEVTRAAQEVQAAMVVAKRFPRDQEAAIARIMQACKRKSLAEDASYAFPRGGTKVTGPSIRLAEVLAQNWGNLDFGVMELERREGSSTAMAYCRDLETNTRTSITFEVRHVRDRSERKGGAQKLTDERDIYELIANMGARRLRKCILGIVPGDVAKAAEEECTKTLAGGNAEPLIDRVRKMVTAFNDHGVNPEMIEARLGHKLAATTEAELVQLRRIFTSLRDGMAKVADFFDPNAKSQSELNDRLNDGDDSKADEKKPAPTTPEPQAPVEQTNGMTAWEQSLAVCREALDGYEQAPSEKEFDTAINMWLLAKGCRGKTEKLTPDQIAELVQAVVQKKFDFKTGRVTK